MMDGLTHYTLPGVACLLAACGGAGQTAPVATGSGICTPTGLSQPLRDLPEASGLTLSRRAPGVLWTHNDSGEPVVFALNAAGVEQGRVRLANATVYDWEDITAGPCPPTALGAGPGGSCLYVADIGDNNTARRSLTLYRLPEPASRDTSAIAEGFTVRYPDGAHDAEAVFVTPAGEIFLVTKDATATVYRFPQPLRSGAVLERVTDLPLRRVTDADVSADGRWVAVRTNDDVVFYPTDALTGGVANGTTVSLRALKEPQGEGVALAADGALYLVSEGAGSGRFSTMRCTLPR